MRRRHLLRSAVALALLSVLPRTLRAKPAAGRRTLRRVRPSDPAWPSPARWQGLDDAVGGKLIKVESMFGACAAQPTGAACVDASKRIRNPFYIGDQAAGSEISGWLDAWTPAPSVYAIAARNAGDVVAGVNFARENDLRLVVKGGGHSYQGTSNAADSLLIWTRGMNEVTLHDSFVAKGCEGRAEPVPAVSAGAGAMWIDVYHAVTTEGGRYVQGGGCTTVGVAGLVQSGGFGSFSKRFGTAASGLLEAEVVTADGSVRIVNACTEPDLFWALQGGGGGSFGIVTRLTMRTHALPESFGTARGKIEARSEEAFRRLIARFLGFYATTLFNPHWGEQVVLAPDDTLTIAMNCQGLDGQQTERVWQPFFDAIKASPTDYSVSERLGTRVVKARQWWGVEGNDAMIRDGREGAPAHHGWWRGDQDQVGAFIHGYESLWLPASLLEAAHRRLLADALLAASRHKAVAIHFNKGLAGAPPDVRAAARRTATNPALADAFALVIIAGGERPAYPGLASAHRPRHRARRCTPDRSGRRRAAQDRSARRLLRVGRQLLRPRLADCSLGRELCEVASRQEEVRSRRPVLRPSRCRKRRVECGRVHAARTKLARSSLSPEQQRHAVQHLCQRSGECRPASDTAGTRPAVRYHAISPRNAPTEARHAPPDRP